METVSGLQFTMIDSPPVLVKRHGGMHAAVVEFNALTNAVGTAAQHDHLFSCR